MVDGWGSYGKVSYCFWVIGSSNTALQKSTLFRHCRTMGFDYPTHVNLSHIKIL